MASGTEGAVAHVSGDPAGVLAAEAGVVAVAICALSLWLARG